MSHKEEEAKRFIEEFRARPSPYVVESGVWAPKPATRLELFGSLSPRKVAKIIRWLIKSHLQYLKKNRSDYTDEIPWYSLWDKLKRKAREIRGFSDLYAKPDFENDFAYFPLHLEPEIGILLYAPFYTNQIQLIERIARSLPIHYTLYVKEHPSMVGFRPRRYYKELIKIPNVKILRPNLSSLSIIAKTKILFTIAGTAGWEAVLLKKPVVTFGDVFYNRLSSVKRNHNIEKLPHTVLSLLKDFKPDDRELINYISALLEDSVNASLVNLWEKEDQGEDIRDKDDGLKRLAELLAKKIALSVK